MDGKEVLKEIIIGLLGVMLTVLTKERWLMDFTCESPIYSIKRKVIELEKEKKKITEPNSKNIWKTVY